MSPSTPGERLLSHGEVERMAEQERDLSESDADPVSPKVGQSHIATPPEQNDAERPTDQAITNEERALESGEENVV
jgi:hypothetical protein